MQFTLMLMVLGWPLDGGNDNVIFKAEPKFANDTTRLVFTLGEPVIVRTEIQPAGEHHIRWRVRGDVSTTTFERDTALVVGWNPGEYEAEFLYIQKEPWKVVEKFFIIQMGPRGPPEHVEPEEPIGPITKATKAVVVYESSEQPVSPHAMAAREAIESAEIEYRIVDKDVENGLGQTPAELKPAIEAARAADVGFPVLVIQSGETVTKVISLPLTADAVAKAVIND